MMKSLKEINCNVEKEDLRLKKQSSDPRFLFKEINSFKKEILLYFNDSYPSRPSILTKMFKCIDINWKRSR